LKAEDGLLVARPEGSEVMSLSGGGGSGGDASAKPLLLREACDICEGTEHGPLCVAFCPTNAITLEE
jgi:Fe-S-cluster-containing hydrogenase component 2